MQTVEDFFMHPHIPDLIEAIVHTCQKSHQCDFLGAQKMDPSTATVEKTSLLFTAFEVGMKAGSQTIEPCQQSLGIQNSKDVFTEMKMVFLHDPFIFLFFGNVVGTPWDLVPSKQLRKIKMEKNLGFPD